MKKSFFDFLVQYAEFIPFVLLSAKGSKDCHTTTITINKSRVFEGLLIAAVTGLVAAGATNWMVVQSLKVESDYQRQQNQIQDKNIEDLKKDMSDVKIKLKIPSR